MTHIFESVVKAILGLIFLPVSLVADIFTICGLLVEQPPYTVVAIRRVMRNLDCALVPNEFTEDQVTQVFREMDRRKKSV